MSDSDVSIPQKVAALAGALGRVKQQIFRRGRLFRSFQRWYEAKGEDAILRFLDPMDGSQKDGSLWDGSEDVLDAAAEFVEAVATADQMLNSTPVSALEPLSELTGGVPWDVRTRRALRAIQYETAILECHSMDPEGLLLGLWWMGADRLKQMDSKLMELELELKERIIDLQSLPGVPSGRNTLTSPQIVDQEPVENPNEITHSAGGLVVSSSAMSTEQKDSGVGTLPEKPEQTAKDRESAFDEAISGYANSDWKRDRKLTNKAWRVRSGEQKGELFGVCANERGWYQSNSGKRAIKKDEEGVWVYLTASHSEELKEFFSAFVT